MLRQQAQTVLKQASIADAVTRTFPNIGVNRSQIPGPLNIHDSVGNQTQIAVIEIGVTGLGFFCFFNSSHKSFCTVSLKMPNVGRLIGETSRCCRNSFFGIFDLLADSLLAQTFLSQLIRKHLFYTVLHT